MQLHTLLRLLVSVSAAEENKAIRAATYSKEAPRFGNSPVSLGKLDMKVPAFE